MSAAPTLARARRAIGRIVGSTQQPGAAWIPVGIVALLSIVAAVSCAAGGGWQP